MSIIEPLWRKFAPPFFIVTAILCIGAFGYVILEEYTLLEALYMTVITIATVGFTEIRPLDDAGRVFTIFIILSGIGAGGYAIGNITSFLIGGEARRIFMEAVLENRLSKLNNHIIILGYGKFGRSAAHEIKRKNIPIVVIERVEARMILAKEEGYEAVMGDSTDDHLLEKAGIIRARGVVAALSSEADNVLAVLTARVLNPKLTIVSRGDEEGSEKKLLRAGADRVVLPYEIGGRRMAAIVVEPSIMDFLDIMFSGDELAMELMEFKLKKDSAMIGKSLSESNIRDKTGGALIVGIKGVTGKMITNPKSSLILREGDTLIALGNQVSLDNLAKMAG